MKSKFRRKDTRYLCECGYCNQLANFGKRFVYGHQGKGKNNYQYGQDKYAKEKAKEPPFCGCGFCNKKTK